MIDPNIIALMWFPLWAVFQIIANISISIYKRAICLMLDIHSKPKILPLKFRLVDSKNVVIAMFLVSYSIVNNSLMLITGLAVLGFIYQIVYKVQKLRAIYSFKLRILKKEDLKTAHSIFASLIVFMFSSVISNAIPMCLILSKEQSAEPIITVSALEISILLISLFIACCFASRANHLAKIIKRPRLKKHIIINKVIEFGDIILTLLSGYYIVMPYSASYITGLLSILLLTIIGLLIYTIGRAYVKQFNSSVLKHLTLQQRHLIKSFLMYGFLKNLSLTIFHGTLLVCLLTIK